MEAFLATVGAQAMRYAIRSGIAVTAAYCTDQYSRLLKSVNDKELARELRTLQTRLENKIKILAPALDLIELKSGRGNALLEAAVPLAKSLHQEILTLAERVELTADLSQQLSNPNPKISAKEQAARNESIQLLVDDIRTLLDRVDREIPMLQLAITTSGEVLSTSLPSSISPSRLLQASALLIMADNQHSKDPISTIQVGPTFNLSLYMLFLGHADRFHTTAGGHSSQRDAGAPSPKQRKPIWQEVVHKCQVRLCRASKALDSRKARNSKPDFHEHSFYLDIFETKDDGRLRGEDYSAGFRSEVIHETIPLQQVSKLFYVDTRRILNINDMPSEENKPILLLKRELSGVRPEGPGPQTQDPDPRLSEVIHDESEQTQVDRQLEQESSQLENLDLSEDVDHEPLAGGFPPYLDPQWVAFEMFEDDLDLSDEPSDGDTTTSSEVGSSEEDVRQDLTRTADTPATTGVQGASRSFRSLPQQKGAPFSNSNPFQMITRSLSLLEMLIRLASLQEFQQESHLSISDHVLSFFLEETSPALANTASRDDRQEAHQHVGFDPYTQSPSQEADRTDSGSIQTKTDVMEVSPGLWSKT